MHAESACAPGLRFSLQALPADVRGHRYLHGQRTQKEVQDLGAMDGKAMQEALSGKADARTVGARMALRNTFAVAGCDRDSLCTYDRLIRLVIYASLAVHAADKQYLLCD